MHITKKANCGYAPRFLVKNKQKNLELKKLKVLLFPPKRVLLYFQHKAYFHICLANITASVFYVRLVF